MSTTHVFHARAYLDTDGWWTIEVPELTETWPNGVTTLATGASVTTRGIARAARELVAAWIDAPKDEVEVDISIEAPSSVAELWREGVAAEAEGRSAIEHGAALRREAARTLRAKGYTIEAAAAALGVSRQRIQQLTS